MGAKKPKMEVVEYYMSMHQSVCMGPVDEVRGIIMAEKEAWKGVISNNSSFTINKPDLHGGVKKEGGAVGRVEVLMGGVEQSMPQYLATKMNLTTETCPAYRGVFSLFFSGTRHRGFYWTANQPYLRSIWVVAKRYAKGLGSANMMIGNDSNPAHIIYETLTNETWGEGSPSSTLDMDSLEALAKTMFDEKLGLSLLWVNQGTIENFITEILDHIQATLFINPRTGLLTVKALRGDYDPDTLRVISPDNAVLSKFQRKGWGETANEIVVTWTNPENEQEETVSIQDTANIAMQGGVVSESRNYYGVRNSETAMALAARDLRTASAPLAICSAIVNRTGWDVIPGEVLKVYWPERGLDHVVFRVVDVDYGLTTDTSVRINLSEDIFAFTTASYVNPPTSEWVDPSEQPRPMKDYLIFTLPYLMVMTMVDSDALFEIKSPLVIAGVFGAQSGDDTFEFDIVSPTTPPSEQIDDGVDETSLSITSQGNIVAPLIAEATSVNVRVLNLTAGRVPQVGTYLFLGEHDIDMEICLVTGSGESGYTLRRGVLDTVPREWGAGARVWVLATDAIIYDPEQKTAGVTVSYKMLPRTSLGRLPWESAPVVSGQMTDRPWMPTRPARCRINGTGFGTVNLVGVPTINATWANRNRLTEDTQVLSWDEANVTPEDGQTTTIIIRNTQGVEVNRLSGITGTSRVIDRADFMLLPEAIVEFIAVRGGVESLQGYRLNVVIDAVSPGHRYWRLLFPDGAVNSSYVQIVNLRLFSPNVILEVSNALATMPVDGVAMASSFDGSVFGPESAFDGTSSTSWSSQSPGAGQWLGFYFNSPQRIDRATYSTVTHAPARIPSSATLQHSDDGLTWVNAYGNRPVRNPIASTGQSLVYNPAVMPVNDGKPHRFWRVRSFSRIGNYVQWSRVKFMFNGVEKSVGGTPTASSVYSATYPATAAFVDGSTYWCSTSGTGGHDWLRYEFVEATQIDQVLITVTSPATTDGGQYLFVEYSDNGTLWYTAKFNDAPNALTHDISVT